MNGASRLERLATWVLVALAPPYERDALVGDVLERHRTRRNALWLMKDVLAAIGSGIAHRIRRHGLSFAGALLAAWTTHVVLHVSSLSVATRASRGAHDLVMRADSFSGLGDATMLMAAKAVGVALFAGWVLGVALICGYVAGRLHHAYRRFVLAVFALFAAYPSAVLALQHLVEYLSNPRVGWDAQPFWHQTTYALAAVVGVLWGGSLSSNAAALRRSSAI